MRKLLFAALCSGLLLSCVSWARAQTVAGTSLTALVLIDDVSGTVRIEMVPGPGKALYSFLGSVTTDQGDSLTFTATGNPDPSLAYAISAVDAGAPSSFTVLISMPTAPTGPPAHANGSVSYSVTDSGSDGASLTQVPGGAVAIYSSLGVGSLGVDVGSTFGFTPAQEPPFTQSSPNYTSSGPVPFQVNSLQAAVLFEGSGGWDTYGISGQVRLDALPDSTALAGFVPALGVLGLVLRRRRS